MKRLSILIAILVLVWTQSVPQIAPVDPTLRADTSYTINYYSFKNLVGTSTYFKVDFSASKIQVPQGELTSCKIKFNSVAVSNPLCSCDAGVCTFKPRKSAQYNTKVEIELPGAKNPSYLSSQTLPVFINFSPSITSESHTVTIPYSAYIPMSIQVNSLTQSDYGVGKIPVTYAMNVSLSYISADPQLQIVIPQEVNIENINCEISFYGTVQNIFPLQVQNLLIFNLQTAAIPEPSGFMLITIQGLGNPQFLGKSESFKLTFMETQDVKNCASCKIAELTAGLEAESKTPGDIQPTNLASSNQTVGMETILSLNSKYYAPIPVGGYVRIYMP